LSTELAERIIRLSERLGAEYADVRVERIYSTDIRLTQDTFDQVASGVDQGFGVRVLYDGVWGFGSSTSLKSSDISKAVQGAFKAAKATALRTKERAQLAEVPRAKRTLATEVKIPMQSVSMDEKMKLALDTSNAAKTDRRIASVTVTYSDSSGETCLATSEGTRLVGKPSRGSLVVVAVAKSGEKIGAIRERNGMQAGFELFKKIDPLGLARKAADRAVKLLEAVHAPSGRFTAIADQKLAGVFAHEAVGHASEADHVITGESVLKDKVGQRVGSDPVTLYDDSTYSEGWGTSLYDSEGVPTQRRLIIESGFLRGYILNREAAAQLDMKPNGGARAQSFIHRPVVRMSNTYLTSGNHSFEELLEGIDYGVYLKGSRGGQVDTAKGTFQFSAEEGYLIERGQLTKPVSDVSLSGMTLETLMSIDGVANDFQMSIGLCGKAGQVVTTGMGSPHIRIRNAVIGGK
jgi:TldD protein